MPTETSSDPGPLLIDVRAVASLLGCSPRHVYRLSADARMPRPIRLGCLVRWDRRSLARWVADGCPDLQHCRR